MQRAFVVLVYIVLDPVPCDRITQTKLIHQRPYVMSSGIYLTWTSFWQQILKKMSTVIFIQII